MAMQLDQLAAKLGATVMGDGNVTVTGCASIDTARSDEVTFLANRRYIRYLDETKAAGVLIDPETPCPDHVTRLVCPDPYFAFRNALIEFHGFRRHPAPMDAPTPEREDDPRISARAMVHPTASVGDRTSVHPFSVVERGARVGRDCVLYPGTFIGPDAVVGDECLLYPGVVIYDRTVLGNRVNIHSGTVVGQDGFGYATHAGAHHKIPQAGWVEIGDDVEIGACCAIDRATVGTTAIGAGTKFSNLVAIGHGTKVGRGCLFVAQAGIAGSTNIGDYCTFAGQVGVVGHITIGNKVRIGAKAGVTNDIAAGQEVFGQPAMPRAQAARVYSTIPQLPQMRRQIKALQAELERLKRRLDEGEAGR
jgi:UDP-3-O-[3-hydroxymyristoyl] glucosamine N-acyltransferase